MNWNCTESQIHLKKKKKLTWLHQEAKFSLFHICLQLPRSVLLEVSGGGEWEERLLPLVYYKAQILYHFKMSWSSTALKITIVKMIVKLYHFF